MEKKLGKGIAALIPGSSEKGEKSLRIKVDQIMPNKYQPRKRFNEEKLKELINSIREKGIIQPVVVRPVGDEYELIAGERRFRAVKDLGYSHIPAIVKEVDDADSLEMSLIENIQREELNAIEEANAYRQLIEQFKFSQEEISKAVGKDKSSVSNTLRLLTLPTIVRQYIEQDLISMGHAKAILALNTEREKIRYAKKVIRKALSVRQIEDLVRTRYKASQKKVSKKDENLASMEEKLQHILGTRVRIISGKKRGRVEIQYFSNEDLERIVSIISN